MPTLKQPQRKINRKVFNSKLYLDGLTLQSLGEKLSPPVKKARVSQIINRAAPTKRLQEIASILKSNIQTLFPAQ